MSGINAVLSIAKCAIFAQQTGLNITGNNIANVSTEGYSRQSVLYQSNQAVLGEAGVFVGNGVHVEEVQRSCDQLLEKRLMGQKSTLAACEESAQYLNIMEGLLNENSETGISTMMSEFWNAWHDLSNNPGGSSERISLYEQTVRFSDGLNTLSYELNQIRNDLTSELENSVTRINELSAQVAAVNNEIMGMQSSAEPNDQKDLRNSLIVQLAELVDINSFEQPDGSVTVTAAGGYALVNGTSANTVQVTSNRVLWGDPKGGNVDITDRISGGKIGGWLEVRDEILPKYQAEFDATTKEMIWAVNYQHSQGAGLEFFSQPLTGTYAVDASGRLDSLPFGDRIDYTADFGMWVQNGAQAPVKLSMDMDISTAQIGNWTGQADDAGGAPYTYRFTVTEGGTVDTEPVNENPQIHWEKINSSGEVIKDDTIADVNAGTLRIDDASNPGTAGIAFDIGAGDLVAGNTFTLNTDAAGKPDPLEMSVSGTANSVSDTYRFKVVSDTATLGTGTLTLEWVSEHASGTITLQDSDSYPVQVDVDGMTLEFTEGTVWKGDCFTIDTDAYGNPSPPGRPSDWHWTLDSFTQAFNAQTASAGLGISAEVTSSRTFSLVPAAGVGFAFGDDLTEAPGLAAALGINTFFDGFDAVTMGVNSVLENNAFIAAAKIDVHTGTFGSGDNRNALAVADVQYASLSMTQWTFRRQGADTSKLSNATLEDFYRGMVGTLGIKSSNVSRARDFAETLASQIQQQRDGISGVSLDEELINMIKFQQAYSAAAKLLSVADEMMTALVNSK